MPQNVLLHFPIVDLICLQRSVREHTRRVSRFIHEHNEYLNKCSRLTSDKRSTPFPLYLIEVPSQSNCSEDILLSEDDILCAAIEDKLIENDRTVTSDIIGGKSNSVISRVKLFEVNSLYRSSDLEWRNSEEDFRNLTTISCPIRFPDEEKPIFFPVPGFETFGTSPKALNHDIENTEKKYSELVCELRNDARKKESLPSSVIKIVKKEQHKWTKMEPDKNVEKMDVDDDDIVVLEVKDKKIEVITLDGEEEGGRSRIRQRADRIFRSSTSLRTTVRGSPVGVTPSSPIPQVPQPPCSSTDVIERTLTPESSQPPLIFPEIDPPLWTFSESSQLTSSEDAHPPLLTPEDKDSPEGDTSLLLVCDESQPSLIFSDEIRKVDMLLNSEPPVSPPATSAFSATMLVSGDSSASESSREFVSVIKSREKSITPIAGPSVSNNLTEAEESVSVSARPENLASNENLPSDENLACNENLPRDENLACNENLPSDENLPCNENLPSDENFARNENLASDTTSPQQSEPPPIDSVEMDDVVITPKKTTDITKIKGWKRKQFLVERSFGDDDSNSRKEENAKQKGATKKPQNKRQVVFTDDIEGTKTVDETPENAFVCDSLDKFLEGGADLNIDYEVPHLYAELGIKLTKDDVLSRPNMTEEELKRFEGKYRVPIEFKENANKLVKSGKVEKRGVKRKLKHRLHSSKARKLEVNGSKKSTVNVRRKQTPGVLFPNPKSTQTKVTSQRSSSGPIESMDLNGEALEGLGSKKVLGLALYPGPNAPLPKVVQRHLDNIRSYRNTIDRNWANFALSALGVPKKYWYERMILPIQYNTEKLSESKETTVVPTVVNEVTTELVDTACMKPSRQSSLSEDVLTQDVSLVESQMPAKLDKPKRISRKRQRTDMKTDEQDSNVKDFKVLVRKVSNPSRVLCMEHNRYNCKRCDIDNVTQGESRNQSDEGAGSHELFVMSTPLMSEKDIYSLLIQKLRTSHWRDAAITDVDILRNTVPNALEIIKCSLVRDSFLKNHIFIWYLKPYSNNHKSRAFFTFSKTSPVPFSIRLQPNPNKDEDVVPKIIRDIITNTGDDDENEYAILHCSEKVWEIHGSLRYATSKSNPKSFGQDRVKREEVFTPTYPPELERISEAGTKVIKEPAVRWWVVDITQKFTTIVSNLESRINIMTRKSICNQIRTRFCGFMTLNKTNNRVLWVHIFPKILPYVLIGPYKLSEPHGLILKQGLKTVPFSYNSNLCTSPNFPLKKFFNSVITQVKEQDRELKALWLCDRQQVDKTCYLEMFTSMKENNFSMSEYDLDVEHGYSLKSLINSPPLKELKRASPQDVPKVKVYLYFDLVELGYVTGELSDDTLVTRHPLTSKSVSMPATGFGNWFLKILKRKMHFIPQDLKLKWYVTKHFEELKDREPFSDRYLKGFFLLYEDVLDNVLKLVELNTDADDRLKKSGTFRKTTNAEVMELKKLQYLLGSSNGPTDEEEITNKAIGVIQDLESTNCKLYVLEKEPVRTVLRLKDTDKQSFILSEELYKFGQFSSINDYLSAKNITRQNRDDMAKVLPRYRCSQIYIIVDDNYKSINESVNTIKEPERKLKKIELSDDRGKKRKCLINTHRSASKISALMKGDDEWTENSEATEVAEEETQKTPTISTPGTSEATMRKLSVDTPVKISAGNQAPTGAAISAQTPATDFGRSPMRETAEFSARKFILTPAPKPVQTPATNSAQTPAGNFVNTSAANPPQTMVRNLIQTSAGNFVVTPATNPPQTAIGNTRARNSELVDIILFDPSISRVSNEKTNNIKNGHTSLHKMQEINLENRREAFYPPTPTPIKATNGAPPPNTSPRPRPTSKVLSRMEVTFDLPPPSNSQDTSPEQVLISNPKTVPQTAVHEQPEKGYRLNPETVSKTTKPDQSEYLIILNLEAPTDKIRPDQLEHMTIINPKALREWVGPVRSVRIVTNIVRPATSKSPTIAPNNTAREHNTTEREPSNAERERNYTAGQFNNTEKEHNNTARRPSNTERTPINTEQERKYTARQPSNTEQERNYTVRQPSNTGQERNYTAPQPSNTVNTEQERKITARQPDRTIHTDRERKYTTRQSSNTEQEHNNTARQLDHTIHTDRERKYTTRQSSNIEQEHNNTARQPINSNYTEQEHNKSKQEPINTINTERERNYTMRQPSNKGQERNYTAPQPSTTINTETKRKITARQPDHTIHTDRESKYTTRQFSNTEQEHNNTARQPHNTEQEGNYTARQSSNTINTEREHKYTKRELSNTERDRNDTARQLTITEQERNYIAREPSHTNYTEREHEYSKREPSNTERGRNDTARQLPITEQERNYTAREPSNTEQERNNFAREPSNTERRRNYTVQQLDDTINTEREHKYTKRGLIHTEGERNYTARQPSHSNYTEREHEYNKREPSNTEQERNYTSRQPSRTNYTEREHEYTKREPSNTERENNYTSRQPSHTNYTEREHEYTKRELSNTEQERNYTALQPSHTNYTEREHEYTKREPSYTERENNYTGRRSTNTEQEGNYTVRQPSSTERERHYTARQSSNTGQERNYTAPQPSNIERKRNFTAREPNNTEQERNYTVRQPSHSNYTEGEHEYTKRELSNTEQERNYTARQSTNTEQGGNYNVRQPSSTERESHYTARQPSNTGHERNYTAPQPSNIERKRNYSACEPNNTQQERNYTMRQHGNTIHTERNYTARQPSTTEQERNYTTRQHSNSDYTEREHKYTRRETSNIEQERNYTAPQHENAVHIEGERNYTARHPSNTERERIYTAPQPGSTIDSERERNYTARQPSYTEHERNYTPRQPSYTINTEQEFNYTARQHSNTEHERNYTTRQPENTIRTERERNYTSRQSSNSEEERNYTARQPTNTEHERNYTTRLPGNTGQEQNYTAAQPSNIQGKRNYTAREPNNTEQERNYTSRQPSNTEQERKYTARQPGNTILIEGERNYTSRQPIYTINTERERNHPTRQPENTIHTEGERIYTSRQPSNTINAEHERNYAPRQPGNSIRTDGQRKYTARQPDNAINPEHEQNYTAQQPGNTIHTEGQRNYTARQPGNTIRIEGQRNYTARQPSYTINTEQERNYAARQPSNAINTEQEGIYTAGEPGNYIRTEGQRNYTARQPSYTINTEQERNYTARQPSNTINTGQEGIYTGRQPGNTIRHDGQRNFTARQPSYTEPQPNNTAQQPSNTGRGPSSQPLIPILSLGEESMIASDECVLLAPELDITTTPVQIPVQISVPQPGNGANNEDPSEILVFSPELGSYLRYRIVNQS